MLSCKCGDDEKYGELDVEGERAALADLLEAEKPS